MKPERWERVNTLFRRACELDSPERDDYLNRACSDDAALCRTVNQLVASHQKAENFLETPALEVAAGVLGHVLGESRYQGKDLEPERGRFEPGGDAEESYLDASMSSRVMVGEVALLRIALRSAHVPATEAAHDPERTPELWSQPELWIQIDTTDFSLTDNRQKIGGPPGKSIEVLVFRLIPIKKGDLSLIIQAQLDDEALLASGLLKVQGVTKRSKALDAGKKSVSLSLGFFAHR